MLRNYLGKLSNLRRTAILNWLTKLAVFFKDLLKLLFLGIIIILL